MNKFLLHKIKYNKYSKSLEVIYNCHVCIQEKHNFPHTPLFFLWKAYEINFFLESASETTH